MSSPSEVDALCEKARDFHRQGQLAKAITLYEQVVEVDDAHFDAHNGLGMAFFALKDFDAAIKHLTRMTKIRPWDGKALINLGAVQNSIGDHKTAMETLRKGVQREKRCAEGYYNLGIAYRKTSQLAMAVSAYREAIRINPEMAEAYCNLANVYFDMGNFQQAVVNYNKALDIDPRLQRAKMGLASARKSIDESKKENNPFGRLVDLKKPHELQNPSVTDAPEMTHEERFKDQEAVFKLAVDIEESTEELFEQVRDELEVVLLALSRSIVRGQHGASTVHESHESYQEAVRKFARLRRTLKQKLARLAAHEESLRK